MAPFPFPQLSELREKYIYNIRPLTSSFALVKKGLQLFQSDDEDEPENDESLMVATWFLANPLNSSKSRGNNIKCILMQDIRETCQLTQIISIIYYVFIKKRTFSFAYMHILFIFAIRIIY